PGGVGYAYDLAEFTLSSCPMAPGTACSPPPAKPTLTLTAPTGLLPPSNPDNPDTNEFSSKNTSTFTVHLTDSEQADDGRFVYVTLRADTPGLGGHASKFHTDTKTGVDDVYQSFYCPQG